MSSRAKLKWHCRRGMRELDVLLDGFLEQRYDGLSEVDRMTFERLLDESNEDLAEWLLEGSAPPDSGYARLVLAIRDVAASIKTG